MPAKGGQEPQACQLAAWDGAVIKQSRAARQAPYLREGWASVAGVGSLSRTVRGPTAAIVGRLLCHLRRTADELDELQASLAPSFIAGSTPGYRAAAAAAAQPPAASSR